MRLAAPVAVGRERHQPRVERGRRRERRGDQIGRAVAAPARQSRALRRDVRGRAARPGTAAHTARCTSAPMRSRRVSRSVASTTSSRNPGCPRLSTQHLGVAAAERRHRRPRRRRGAANQLPQRGHERARAPPWRRRARPAPTTTPPRVPVAATRPVRRLRAAASSSTRSRSRESCPPAARRWAAAARQKRSGAIPRSRRGATCRSRCRRSRAGSRAGRRPRRSGRPAPPAQPAR